MQNTSGSSVLLHFYALFQSGYVWGAPAAGYSNLVSTTSGSTNHHVCLDTKGVSTSDGAVIHGAANVSTWSACSVEVKT
jgi:hypothetical protein